MKWARNLLLIGLGFLGLGALGGGGALILSPSGEWLEMPLYILNDTPFTNFLIPGIILFTLLGVAPILLLFALRKKPVSPLAERINIFSDMHWSWTFCIYIALILMGWIQIQMAFLRSVVWLHTFYMFLAMALVVLALLPQVRGLYRRG